ncbi:MAG: HD domain-containing protein, partial [Methanomassiliicoccus sp.]
MALLLVYSTIISHEDVLATVVEYKIIRDSVHGSIKVDGCFLPLASTPELQRLHNIHQLGLAYLVYPGANHTRFEHSLGTFHVAGRICSSLNLDRIESLMVQAAALLHDIGHLPYSHTFEMVLHEQFGVDHAEISRRLIRGEDSVLADEERSILGKHASVPEALEAMSLNPKDVAGLLDDQHALKQSSRTLEKHESQAHFNTKRYLSQIVSGTVDADQLDYLVRDAHYTGVAYGVIDIDRLVETFDIYNGDLVIDKSGLSAVEGMLVARALMFSSVYYHKTVRIPELMLAKAVELLGKDAIDRIHRKTDAGLLAYLESQGGYSREIATCLKYRKLYKRAYAIAVTDVRDEDWSKIDELGNVGRRRAVEADIARRAGIPSGNVIMDVPSTELPLTEPRISLMDVRILDGKRVRLLPRMSSIASSLQFRRAHDWAIMVACPEKDKA